MKLENIVSFRSYLCDDFVYMWDLCAFEVHWFVLCFFLQFKPDEITGIMKDFDEPGHLAPTGMHLGEIKYMVIQGEPGAVIRGKKVTFYTHRVGMNRPTYQMFLQLFTKWVMHLEEFIWMILISTASFSYKRHENDKYIVGRAKTYIFLYAHCAYTFTMLYSYIYLENLHIELSFIVKFKCDFWKFVTSC